MEPSKTNSGYALPPQTARRKRQKVPIACVPCRRKKMKCDAARPTCGGCQKSSERAECFYTTRRADGNESSRVQLSSQHLQTSSHSNGDQHPSPLSVVQEPPPGSENVLPHRTSTGETLRSSMPLQSGSQSTNPFDVDSMNGITGDPAQTHEVFGGSSAGSFMRQIQAAINAKQGSSRRPSRVGFKETTEHSLQDYPLSTHEEATLSVLPARGMGDRLIQAYWDFEWTLYPIINRRYIETYYQSLWSSQPAEFSPISMSTINVCFALGCHYCQFLPPKDRKSTGKDFFARAERLYMRSGHSSSLERVQLLLIIGIYLQSTNNVSRCWMTVGEAIRMAQSLGVYLDQHSSTESISGREIKRRTWHGCVWLDRVVSATLGRPGMIPNWLFNSIPLPSMIDDEFLDTQSSGSDTRPDGRPSLMAFSVKAFELYQILDEILFELYLTSTKNNKLEEKLSHLLEIDKKLQAWKLSLPSHLQYESSTSRDAIVDRQATVLRIRYLHVRILLLRPTLVTYCIRGSKAYPEQQSPSSGIGLSEVMLFECSRMCFQHAHDLINIFNEKLVPETVGGPLPSWWYSVLYIYTAATTTIVERFLKANHNIPSSLNGRNTWDVAMHVLRSYSQVADSAKKCMDALGVLAEGLFPGEDGSTVATDQDAESDPQKLLEISMFLSEQTSILPFGFDDFLWLG